MAAFGTYKKKTIAMKKYAAVLLLLGKITASDALTLGALQGSSVLGKPLAVAIDVQMDADDVASSLCFESRVVQGDAREVPSTIKIIGDSSSAGGLVRVLITSPIPVLEPVVSLEMRAGCKQTITRRYVLLPDIDSTVSAVAMPDDRVKSSSFDVISPALANQENVSKIRPSSVPDRQPVVNAGAPPKVQPGSPGSSKIVTGADKPRPGAKLVKPSKVGGRAVGPVESAAPVMEGARLKLSSSALLAEKTSGLKVTPEISKPAAEDRKEGEQAGAIWRAANLPVEEVAQEFQRVTQLRGEIKTLQALAESNQKMLLEMRVALEKSESTRVDVGWVYGLGAALFGSIAAFLFFFRKRRSSEQFNWWQSRLQEAETPNHSVANVLSGLSVAPVSGQPLSKDASESLMPSPIQNTEVDIDIGLYEESHQSSVVKATVDGSPSITFPFSVKEKISRSESNKPVDFQNSSHGALRVAAVEELFDIRQQADFFVSLGQYDQAIHILRDCIGAPDEARPIAYIDLLGIFYTLGRKTEYDQCAKSFESIFSCKVPPFDKFLSPGLDIQNYKNVFDEILNKWLSFDSIDIFEELIFSDAENPRKIRFELTAFEDILMLHGITKRLLGSDAGFLDTNRAALIKNPFASKIDEKNMPKLDSVNVDIDLPVIEKSTHTSNTDAEFNSRKESIETNAIDFDINEFLKSK